MHLIEVVLLVTEKTDVSYPIVLLHNKLSFRQTELQELLKSVQILC